MKKLIVVLPLLILLTGCGKNKIENYTLNVTEADVCEFKTFYEDKDLLVSSYCVESAKLKTVKDEEIDLKEVLEKDIIDIKDTLDGQIKESEEKDGTLVLKGKEAHYRILICDDSYSKKEKIVILPLMSYEDFMCKY